MFSQCVMMHFLEQIRLLATLEIDKAVGHHFRQKKSWKILHEANHEQRMN